MTQQSHTRQKVRSMHKEPNLWLEAFRQRLWVQGGCTTKEVLTICADAVSIGPKLVAWTSTASYASSCELLICDVNACRAVFRVRQARDWSQSRSCSQRLSPTQLQLPLSQRCSCSQQLAYSMQRLLRKTIASQHRCSKPAPVTLLTMPLVSTRTMRFESTTQGQIKRMLKYYRVSC